MSDEPNCFGNYGTKKKCPNCDFAEKCKAKRQQRRNEFSRTIKKSGIRRWFLSFQMALGDLMLSRPDDIVGRQFLLFEAFEKAYGVTKGGLTGLITEKLHKDAVQAEVDLHMYMNAIKTWDKKPGPEELQARVIDPLKVLEKKYGERFKVPLTERPAELLSYILFYIKTELAPQMEFVVDTISCLNMEDTSDTITESDRFKRIDEFTGHKNV